MSDTQVYMQELAQCDLFIDWDEVLLELIASICIERTYQYNEIIFDENSDSDEMYVIARGTVAIRVFAADSYQTITQLRRGQNFGEVALLDEGRRSAAAVAMENGTRLIAIPRDRVLLLCDNVPKLGYRLMRNLATDLATKIRHTDLDIRDHLTYSPSKG